MGVEFTESTAFLGQNVNLLLELIGTVHSFIKKYTGMQNKTVHNASGNITVHMQEMGAALPKVRQRLKYVNTALMGSAASKSKINDGSLLKSFCAITNKTATTKR